MPELPERVEGTKRRAGRPPDVVLSDPTPSAAHLAGVVVGIPVGLAYAAFRLWLRGEWSGMHEPPPPAMLAIAVPVVLAACFSLVRPPVWVSVGPGGLAFRSWWRSGRFSWASIESFELGNPSDPQFAYVTVRSPLRAARLPAFRSTRPDELVRVLREHQGRYAPSRT